ncbi:MAG: hypothetical protein AAB305_07410 [Candidatus Zixiibacteriota bacterium]
MKKSRMYAAVVALLVLALSLFSSPVMPAEHPWDSDDGSGVGGTGTAPIDTSQVLDPTIIQKTYSTGDSGWLTNLVSTISTQLTTSFNSIRSSFTKSGKSTGDSRNRSYRSSGRTTSPSE